jgi:hypothetical protein
MAPTRCSCPPTVSGGRKRRNLFLLGLIEGNGKRLGIGDHHLIQILGLLPHLQVDHSPLIVTTRLVRSTASTVPVRVTTFSCLTSVLAFVGDLAVGELGSAFFSRPWLRPPAKGKKERLPHKRFLSTSKSSFLRYPFFVRPYPRRKCRQHADFSEFHFHLASSL